MAADRPFFIGIVDLLAHESTGSIEETMKRIFVSDVHMGAGKGFQPGYTGHSYDWLSATEAQVFADFLSYLNKGQYVGVNEIILLGDIIDNWVCPVATTPPTLDEIVGATINQPIITNLKALSQNNDIKVTYVPGNHDMTICKDFANSFPGMAFSEVYDKDDIFAAHGSEYSMFCATDFVNDNINGLPIGYYISRVGATNTALTGSDNSPKYFMGDIINETVESTPLVDVVFAAIVDKIHLHDDTEIIMKAGRTTVKDVKSQYANLYAQWGESSKGIAPKEALIAEVNDIFSIPETLNRLYDFNFQHNYRIIIFGHTHNKDLRRMPTLVPSDKISLYANTGTWCEYDEQKTLFSFIETEKNDTDCKHYVRLKTWDPVSKRPHTFSEDCIEQ
jgi:UDP-2,3-diacylglucosamine pyrophosphatase LpxH